MIKRTHTCGEITLNAIGSSVSLNGWISKTRDLGGDYADMAKAMGGWAEKISDPDSIRNAFTRAKAATENGQAALLEFVTSEEQDFSFRGSL